MKFLHDLKTYYNSEQSYQKIIIWNIFISVFFLIIKAYSLASFTTLLDWFGLIGNSYQSIIKPWTYVTYAFLHADLFHLLSNVIMLYFSARLFSTYFSNTQFITVYFLGIIFSGIVYVFVSFLFKKDIVLVGASAGILAVLFTVVTYSPFSQIKLALLGNVKLWMIGAVLIVFFLIQIPTSNFGGHIAHFAGVFFGCMFAKLLTNGYDISQLFAKLIYYFSKKSARKKQIKNTPFKKIYYNETTAKKSVHIQVNEKQKRIDDILDKISSSGYDSLTIEEKNFLFKAGKE